MESLTEQIERALLLRHPVTLPPERARNYAELAAFVTVQDRNHLLAEIRRLKAQVRDHANEGSGNPVEPER
jgi:hypothetical protein